jgi:hypothetical protein
MSDNYIILIPESPTFVPAAAAQEKAAELFRKLTGTTSEIESETSQQIRFIDCGANFEKILCPKCLTEISIDWWQDWMSEEADADFPLRPTALPCCGAKYNLNELNYDWPQGFAIFSLQAMNPCLPDLTSEQIKQFENLLGCMLRKILRHI